MKGAAILAGIFGILFIIFGFLSAAKTQYAQPNPNEGMIGIIGAILVGSCLIYFAVDGRPNRE